MTNQVTYRSDAYAPESLIANNPELLVSVVVTLLAGQNLKRGALLGKITSSGKYALSLSAASDGSQVPVAIMVDDVDASTGDKPVLVYVRGDFLGSDVILGAGHTIASVTTVLRDSGIFLISSIAAGAVGLALIGAPILSAQVGNSAAWVASATGGLAPYTFTRGGPLPAGQTYSPGATAATFGGTFTTVATYAGQSLTVTDALGNTATLNWSTAITAVSAPAGTVQLSAGAYAAAEGTATVTITVTRTGGSSGAASVNYATSNGTATAGSDYTATSGTLNWADGDAANKTFTVAIADDAVVDPAETFTVTLSGATGATLGTPNTATVTITDNDAAVSTAPRQVVGNGSATTAALFAASTPITTGNPQNGSRVIGSGTAGFTSPSQGIGQFGNVFILASACVQISAGVYGATFTDTNGTGGWSGTTPTNATPTTTNSGLSDAPMSKTNDVTADGSGNVWARFRMDNSNAAFTGSIS